MLAPATILVGFNERLFCTKREDRRLKVFEVVLGGLGVTCSPRDPRFAGSNPAEVDGFFQDVKNLSTSTLSCESRV